MSEPTYADIEEHRQGLLKQWEKFREQYKEIEALLNGDYLIRTIRKDKKSFKLGIAATKMQAMVDSMITNKPKVTREPIAEGIAHKDLANKGEKWGEAVLEEIAVAKQMVPPFKSAGRYLGMGYAILVTRLDDSVYGKKPEGKAKREKWEKEKPFKFPFVIEAPNPCRILLPPMEREPSMAIESQTLKVFEVQSRYPGLELGSSKMYDQVEIVHFWTPEWHVVCKGTEIFVLPNVYGFVSYTHAFAGYGWEHAPTYSVGEGSQSDLGPHPEDLARSLLWSAKDSIIATVEITNAMHEYAMRGIFYTLLTPGDNEGIARQLAEADIGAIVSTEGVDPTKIIPLSTPDLPPYIFNVDSLFKQEIEMDTFPAVVQGEIAPNVTTATQTAVSLSAARMKFELPIQQLNYMASMSLGYCARMLTAIGETMRIGGVTINGDTFEGNYRFKVDFMSKDPGERLRASADGREEVKLGGKSLETHMQEDEGIGDATGETMKIWI